MLVVAPQFSLPQDTALPRLDLRHDVGQQAQRVVGRHDGYAKHVAEQAENEQRLHRGAYLERLLRELVAEHAVEQLAQSASPAPGVARAIVLSAMTELIGVATVAIVAWFAAGTIWNVSKGRALMRWMQGGLPVLGERTTVRWLGSTAIELMIRDGKAPFADVTVVIFLEPRDVPWLWALGRSRGRSDTLIVRGILRQIPSVELEALDPVSWSGRDAVRRVPREWLARQVAAPGEVVVHHINVAALARADALLELARRAGMAVRRLSVRRSAPNFQLHVSLPDRRQPAREFFEAVHALAERAFA